MQFKSILKKILLKINPVYKTADYNRKQLDNIAHILQVQNHLIKDIQNQLQYQKKIITPTTHQNIFYKFYNYDDSYWVDLLFKSIDTRVINGVSFPGFPQEDYQIATIGSSGTASLYEPKHVYSEIRRITKSHNKQFNEQSTLLDFACGYGRMVRFFMKDIYPGNLFASDVRDDSINLCRSLFSCKTSDKTITESGVIFDVNNPFPPLKYKENTFDVIMAYSLFSHLNEEAHLAWLKEFSRILKPDGFIFITFRQHSFLKLINEIQIDPSNYILMLKKAFEGNIIQKRYNNGEYIYNPTGGGDVLSDEFYGDTIIPDQYLLNKWTEWFDIVEHYDDPARLPQAFICLKPKNKKGDRK